MFTISQRVSIVLRPFWKLRADSVSARQRLLDTVFRQHRVAASWPALRRLDNAVRHHFERLKEVESNKKEHNNLDRMVAAVGPNVWSARRLYTTAASPNCIVIHTLCARHAVLIALGMRITSQTRNHTNVLGNFATAADQNSRPLKRFI